MLRKQDIAKRISGRFQFNAKFSREVVDAVFDCVQEELERGGDVMIYGFFGMGTKMAMGRNIKPINGEETIKAIPYRKAVCKFSLGFKNRIKEKK